MQETPEIPLARAIAELCEYPTISANWWDMIREILMKPELTPEDGVALARIMEGFWADIERAEIRSLIVQAHIRAAIDMQKGPTQ